MARRRQVDGSFRTGSSTELRTNGGARTARDEAIEGEQHHGPNDGHHEARGFSLLIPAYRPTEKPAEKRPDDPEHSGDHESRRVTSRHQETRDDSDDQPKNDPPQQCPLTVPPRDCWLLGSIQRQQEKCQVIAVRPR